MEFTVGMARLDLVTGDITKQDTDAIVNAANSGLTPGAGVDGAIRRAAGPALTEETRALGGCPTGQARLTGPGTLAVKKVIHAVGPIYADHAPDEAARLLASAHRASLDLARDAGLRSVAFPAVSTGVYGYPMEAAASVALHAVVDWMAVNPQVELVRFVLFDADALRTWIRAAQDVLSGED